MYGILVRVSELFWLVRKIVILNLNKLCCFIILGFWSGFLLKFNYMYFDY